MGSEDGVIWNVGGRYGVRPSKPGDAEAIARLSSQLGYPSDEAQVTRRLAALSDPASHAVYVATGPDGDAVGWLHASVERTVESEPYTEIRGLVVDEALRGRGIGAMLVRAAVAGARERGVTKVRVRSNVVRERTRGFYLSLGFTVVKTQAVFDLNPDPASGL